MTYLVGFGSILVLPQARWSILDAFEARKPVQIDRNKYGASNAFQPAPRKFRISLDFKLSNWLVHTVQTALRNVREFPMDHF